MTAAAVVVPLTVSRDDDNDLQPVVLIISTDVEADCEVNLDLMIGIPRFAAATPQAPPRVDNESSTMVIVIECKEDRRSEGMTMR